MLDIVCPQVFDLAIQWIPSGGRRLRVLRMRRSPCAVANAESDGASNSATLTYRHYPQHRFRPRSGIRWTGGAPNPATAHLPRDSAGSTTTPVAASTDAARGSAPSEAAPEA